MFPAEAMDLSSLVPQAAACVCAVWSLAVFLVQCIGNTKIYRYYCSRPSPPISPSLPEKDVPHITIIRPVKGLEPKLYECIASTFYLDYPKDKLTIRLCVAEKTDPAYPILCQLVADFPQFDAKVLVEDDDPLLHGTTGHAGNLGPNPKIRNISRAYREAEGDLIWIIDCNVWVGKGVAGRMVDKLIGLGPGGKRQQPYKFVHLLPLVVDTIPYRTESPEGEHGLADIVKHHAGGRLDEMFMATTHAKFYSAINTVGIAPCIVGKSNMFRKSHIDMLTKKARNPAHLSERKLPSGIDYFSDYICEDHLIGDMLWRASLPGFRNHGIVLGDMAIQPTAGMTINGYIARRVRWLRARKWTVIAATMVEPGVECFLCCAYAAFAVTTIPFLRDAIGVAPTWTALAKTWLLFTSTWMTGDWITYRLLHTGTSIEIDENTPQFARGTAAAGGNPAKTFVEWLPAWILRELLALPIWTWAVLLGTTVTWRGKTFNVRTDMSVVELTPRGGRDRQGAGSSSANGSGWSSANKHHAE